jgi:transposase
LHVDEERTGAPSYAELAELVAAQAATIKAQAARIEQLEFRVAELERRLGQNSGHSGLPSSRDPVAERKRQAEKKKRRSEGARSPKRRQGKQPGSKGTTLELSANPEEIIDHRPEGCGDCGSALDESDDRGYKRRQVVELPDRGCRRHRVGEQLPGGRQHGAWSPCG